MAGFTVATNSLDTTEPFTHAGVACNSSRDAERIATTATTEIAMLPEIPKEENRKVCHGCGKASFLPYSIRVGTPANASQRVYCSLACAQLHFPGYTGHDSGR
jgi:hypothetical protein